MTPSTPTYRHGHAVSVEWKTYAARVERNRQRRLDLGVMQRDFAAMVGLSGSEFCRRRPSEQMTERIESTLESIAAEQAEVTA